MALFVNAPLEGFQYLLPAYHVGAGESYVHIMQKVEVVDEGLASFLDEEIVSMIGNDFWNRDVARIGADFLFEELCERLGIDARSAVENCAYIRSLSHIQVNRISLIYFLATATVAEARSGAKKVSVSFDPENMTINIQAQS